MFNAPKTRIEAERCAYGHVIKRCYDPQRCAYEVVENYYFHQCLRKPVAGPEHLYCKQHASRVNP